MQVPQQGHRPFVLPVQRMFQLSGWAHQRELGVGQVLLHEALRLTADQTTTGGGVPQWFVLGAGRQGLPGLFEGRQPVQGADGGEDHEEVAGLVLRQRILGPDPDRLELLHFVGHRFLLVGHQRSEEDGVETLGHAAVRGPAGQHARLIDRQ